MDQKDRDSGKRGYFRRLANFLLVFAALYAGSAIWAEITVGRAGNETAFQRLLEERGETFDWVILGASHALPLAYGDIPERLEADAGQTALILADTGAGPVFNRFVLEQALEDVRMKNLVYVIDSFAFNSSEWNEDRIVDRKLLRKTPLRSSTISLMLDYVLHDGVDPRGLIDYLTCFSKLNDPSRFSAQDWRGRENFDREFRASRFATQQRIEYLYPGDDTDPSVRDRYLDYLISLFNLAKSSGARVIVVKMPLPENFRESLPNEADFDAALRDRIAPLDIAYHDFSIKIPEPNMYFDTDHLNRHGVDAFYTEYLRPLLTAL